MKKGLIIAAAMILAVCLGIGGTLAYIFAQTASVVNTFEYGDVNIDLKEDKLNSDGTLDKTTPVLKNEYKYVPGDTLNKRPYVIVKANSQACYLFVKVDVANNTFGGLDGDIVKWSVDASWTKLASADNVWYKEIGVTNTETQYDILSGDKVTVNEKVTKTMINDPNFKVPTMTFTAYAVQKANVANAAAAWAIANGN